MTWLKTNGKGLLLCLLIALPSWFLGTKFPLIGGAVIAILALAANVIVLAIIVKRSVEQKKNPYTNEIFTDTRDFQLAMARAE